MKVNVTPANLGKFFAAKILSKYNQNIMIRFVAIAGMGKSWAALQLAYSISCYIAEKRGGNPSDFFDFERDFAVISQKKVEDVLKHAQKEHVLLLDDIAAKAMNARNYASSESKDMNSIIQTWRPNHNALITTQQAGFLVDKVWRNLFNYQIEIVESNFKKGFVMAKVQEIVYKHNLDKTHYPYIVEGKKKYVRHIIPAPPKEWRQKYEDEREKQLEAIRKYDDELKNESIGTKGDRFNQVKFYTPMVLDIVEKGYKDQDDILDQLREKCFSAPTKTVISTIFKQNGIKKIKNN